MIKVYEVVDGIGDMKDTWQRKLFWSVMYDFLTYIISAIKKYLLFFETWIE